MPRFFIPLLIGSFLFSWTSLASELTPWQCGLVDSTSNYTPDPVVFPPGKREEPLGCSSKPIFQKIIELTSIHLLNLPDSYEVVFHSACVSHDYCYRHGNDTYGFSKAYCDDEFAANLRKNCNDLEVDDDQKASCLRLPKFMALNMKYFAGRYYRAEGRTSRGLYCQYLPDGEGTAKWPRFWEASRKELSPFWKTMEKGSGATLQLGKESISIPDYQKLRQSLLHYFAGELSDEELIQQIQDWLPEASRKNMKTLKEAHSAFSIRTSYLKKMWLSQRNSL